MDVRRGLQVLILVLATKSVAWGEIADHALLAAPQATRDAFASSLEGQAALRRVFAGGHVQPQLLLSVLQNPNLSRHAVEAFLALDKVQHLPGVDRVLRRLEISEAYDDPRTRGPVFELQVAARLGVRAKELSVDVDGHEVDVLLHDGTVVEAKQLDEDPEIAQAQLDKAVAQLRLRGANGKKVMLVTSERPVKGFLGRFKSTFGTSGQVVKIPFKVRPAALLPAPPPAPVRAQRARPVRQPRR
jgi:hypothetical protein